MCGHRHQPAGRRAAQPSCACSASAPKRWASRWPRRADRAGRAVGHRRRLPARRQPSTRCRCACSCRASARSAWRPCWRCRCAAPAVSWCRCRSWCVVERGVIDKPLFTKDLLPVSLCHRRRGCPATAGCDATAGFIDSPLYGLFASARPAGRGRLPGTGAGTNTGSASRPTRSAVRHQVGRRVADHLRDLPRHGCGVRRRPDPDLPAGGGAVPQLPDAADHHGADPADHHRRDAGPCAAACAVHRHLDDRHDRAGRHHRAQLDPAGGLHRAAGGARRCLQAGGAAVGAQCVRSRSR
jgi:hypothetical protein